MYIRCNPKQWMISLLRVTNDISPLRHYSLGLFHRHLQPLRLLHFSSNVSEGRAPETSSKSTLYDGRSEMLLDKCPNLPTLVVLTAFSLRYKKGKKFGRPELMWYCVISV